ncbi:MAG: hypothetical protein OES26_24385 [Gammaproteobacteria bacterium]|nr:hypothetical protein [Gammaproteobacteria bacterium]
MLNKLIKTTFTLLLLAAGPAVAEQSPTVGTVTFTKAAGNYLYIKAEVADKEVWIATLPSRVQVDVGDEVEYMGGMVMNDFFSKTMDQTFAAIVFVDNIRNISKPDPIKDKQVPDDDAHAKLRQPLTEPKAGEIQPVESGETVATVLTQRNALQDKLVRLRAKIMKVSPNIMGKNWVTLQDGTGSAPDDKLIVTTQERVYPGDVVTVKGRVKTDVDLGGRYKYSVVLEQATFTIQP